ncbi:hypothetical protein DZF79_03090 [Vibrio parahaemolyticus]|nr:hypothetical protein [Vibrio parahaemolyticus]
MSRNYSLEVEELTRKLQDLVIWKTNVGDPKKQMYKVLGISRPSHDAYLSDNDKVPLYIWNQLELLNSMPPHTLIETSFPKLVSESVSRANILSATIKSWEQLTGIPITTIKGTMFAGHFSPIKANQSLNKALEEDKSGVAFALMMEEYIETILSSKEISLSQLSDPNSSLFSTIKNYAQCKAFLSHKSVTESTDRFKEMCEKAIKFYKPESKVTQEYLKGTAIHLLMNAKKSFTDLRKYSIASSGKAIQASSLKLQDQIFVFESVSSLVEYSATLPDGFSLNLIRPKRIGDSFFALVAKSGGDIFLLSDKPDDSEFAKDFYSKRNDRYNIHRWDDTYFPYYIIPVSHDGKHLDTSDNVELSIYEGNGLNVVSHFNCLHSETILWFTFLIEECRNHLFAQENPAVPRLGFVGENSIPHPLLENKTESAKSLPSTLIASSSIEVKSAPELDRDNFLSHSPESAKFKAKNGWMEEMYSAQIDSSLLYIPSEISAPLALRDNRGLFGVSVVKPESGKGLALKFLPSTMIGTPEEIQKEADLIARYNKAQLIRANLKKDFIENRDKVEMQLIKLIKANLPNIVDQLVSLNHSYFSIAKNIVEIELAGELPENILRQVHVSKFEGHFDFRSTFTPLHKALKARDSKGNAFCVMTGEDYPSEMFYLNVSCIHDLEILTGLPRNKLPIQLQNWNARSDLVADSRSIHYDPIEDIRNPWDDFVFGFSIPLSKSFVLSRRKALGVKGRYSRPMDYFDSKDDSMMNFLLNNDEIRQKIRDNKIHGVSFRDYKGFAMRPKFSSFLQGWKNSCI